MGVRQRASCLCERESTVFQSLAPAGFLLAFKGPACRARGPGAAAVTGLRGSLAPGAEGVSADPQLSSPSPAVGALPSHPERPRSRSRPLSTHRAGPAPQRPPREAIGACAAASGRGPAESTPGVVVPGPPGPRGRAGCGKHGGTAGIIPGNKSPLRGPSSAQPPHPTAIPHSR